MSQITKNHLIYMNLDGLNYHDIVRHLENGFDLSWLSPKPGQKWHATINWLLRNDMDVSWFIDNRNTILNMGYDRLELRILFKKIFKRIPRHLWDERLKELPSRNFKDYPVFKQMIKDGCFEHMLRK